MEKENKKKDIQENNMKINLEIVNKYERLERDLARLGVDTKPKRAEGYKPRGTYIFNHFNQKRNTQIHRLNPDSPQLGVAKCIFRRGMG
ncbi:MAG: hypothetical protein AB1896_18930 [Thermodesulfobacteriota bacterium]